MTKDKRYPITDTTRMLGDLLMRTEPIAGVAKQELLAASAEVRKYESLLAVAKERQEMAQSEYHVLRELMMSQWEQMKSDILKAPAIPDEVPVGEPDAATE